MHPQNNYLFQYEKAKYPSEFTNLLGVGNEKYCRYAWSHHINPGKNPKKPPAWQAIGQRQSGKPVTSLLDFKLQSEGYVKALGNRLCSLDVFLSPNQFFDWRNTKQLAQLHANWIDIDTVNHDILPKDQQELIFSEIHQIIRDCGLPAPTSFVSSGSGGMHLYWIYDGTEAFKWRIRIWREITLVLARTFKKARKSNSKWKVDFSASRDPSRVLRLPGTFHGKSGRVVEAYLGGPIYDFNELAGLLIKSEQNVKALESGQSVSPFASSKPVKPVSPAKPPIPATTYTGKHTLSQWWFRIYSVVCTHGRLNGVPVGQRDLYAFILYVALRHIKSSKEDALTAIKSLNSEFIRLNDDELVAYLKTAQEKHYKYSKNSLAEYLESNLGISSGFLYDSETPRLTPDQVKKRQKESAKQTANIRRTKTINALKTAIKTLAETRINVTQENVAVLSGRSVRTVRRYWADLKVSLRSLGVALNIPAPV